MEVLKFPEMRLKKDAVVYQIPIEKFVPIPISPDAISSGQPWRSFPPPFGSMAFCSL